MLKSHFYGKSLSLCPSEVSYLFNPCKNAIKMFGLSLIVLHTDNNIIRLTVYKATVVGMDLKKDADIYDLKVDQVLKEGMVYYSLHASLLIMKCI